MIEKKQRSKKSFLFLTSWVHWFLSSSISLDVGGSIYLLDFDVFIYLSSL